MNFRNLQAGTTIKFYNSWSDQYMIGEIISEKNSGYKVAIKSRVASEIFVEANDISDVIDKTRNFQPVVEEIIEEQPIVEEIIEIKEPAFKGLYADGGMTDSKIIDGLPNELTILIPLFDRNDKPASDEEIDNRVKDVKDFLQAYFGEFVMQDMGSSYIDQEGNLMMRKTIQITSYPSDEEFNYHKKHLIKQLSIWASEWGQDFMILEYEDDMFYIMGNDDMFKNGGELWIQDAVAQMKKKGTIGAFTKQAKRDGVTPIEFAKKVLKNPKGYTLKTRRRANFVRNVNPDKF
jgi:hypothetical protein